MSTAQVPGYVEANADKLHVGCWAESADGSLLLVEGVTRDGSVNYSVVDRSGDTPAEYYGELVEPAFKAEFSDAGWTWHDKTPFPWASVHGGVGSGALAKSVVADRDLLPAVTMGRGQLAH